MSSSSFIFRIKQAPLLHTFSYVMYFMTQHKEHTQSLKSYVITFFATGGPRDCTTCLTTWKRNMLKIWSSTLLNLFYQFKIFSALQCCCLVNRQPRLWFFKWDILNIVAFSVLILLIDYFLMILPYTYF